MCYLEKRCVFVELFPLFKGPGRAHMGPYGPIWTRKIQKYTLEIILPRGLYGALDPALSYSLQKWVELHLAQH